VLRVPQRFFFWQAQAAQANSFVHVLNGSGNRTCVISRC
jgi:hypothetical protein